MNSKIISIESYRGKPNSTATRNVGAMAPEVGAIDIQFIFEQLQSQNFYLKKLAEQQLQIIEGSIKNSPRTFDIDFPVLSYGVGPISSYEVSKITPLLNVVYKKNFQRVSLDSLSESSSAQLSKTLKGGAVLAGAFSVGSLALWGIGYPPILSPFIAILTIMAAPFFYAMGIVHERGDK